MDITLRQLEYLVALEEQRSFRAAAQACHVSQPGLSTQLRTLEGALGVQLFERDRSGTRPTQAGRVLARRARGVLAGARELIEEARGLAAPFASELRLGVIPTIAPYVLPAALAALRRDHPDLRLLPVEATTRELVERAEAGELDVLLLALEADLGSLAHAALYRDPFLLAVPPGHRLAGRKLVRQEDLAGEDLLLLTEGHCLAEQAHELCRAAGARTGADLRATSLTTLVQMVAGGLGLTLVPAMAAAVVRGQAGELSLATFRGSLPGRTVALAWRPTSARRAAIDALAQHLRATAPEGARPPQPASAPDAD